MELELAGSRSMGNLVGVWALTDMADEVIIVDLDVRAFDGSSVYLVKKTSAKETEERRNEVSRSMRGLVGNDLGSPVVLGGRWQVAEERRLPECFVALLPTRNSCFVRSNEANPNCYCG